MTELSLIAKATVILGVTLGAARLAYKAPASLRSLILASAFGLLFLLPAASAIVPAREVGIPVSYAPGFFISRSMPSMPVEDSAALPAMGAQSSATLPPAPATLARAVWGVGVLASAAPLLFVLCRLRGIRHRSRPWERASRITRALESASGCRAVDVTLHGDVVAPMTFGWLRPMIVMPIDAIDWPAADLRQALLHELEHVRRRDWPIHVLARLTCALYWFHPAVWLAWRRLRLESERACDDAVVAQVENTAYAQQLVSLARRYVHHRPNPLLSMADRRTLSTRVACVLSSTVARGRVGAGYTAAIVTCAAGLVLALSPLQARTTAIETQAPNVSLDPALRFEVASVRPSDPSEQGRGFNFSPQSGRIRLRNQTLFTIISIAYAEPFGLWFPEERISGGPDWINTGRFTIEALAGRSVSPREMGTMLRGLLSERFKLKVRSEPRQAPVYALVLANRDGHLGDQLTPSRVDCQAGGGRCGIGGGGPGRYQLSSASMALLAASLSELVGRPVVDRTGLTGSYDGTLTWAPTREELGPDGEPAPRTPELGASIFTALEEQFGLKLQSERGPVDHLVIESADQPTPNHATEAHGALTPN